MRHFLIFLLFLLFLVISCDTIKKRHFTYNPSYYKIYKHKGTKSSVTIYFFEQEKPLLDLPTYIYYNGKETYINKGEIKHTFFNHTNNDLQVQISTSTFGFMTIDFNPLLLKRNDSIIYKVYLRPDKRPNIESM